MQKDSPPGIHEEAANVLVLGAVLEPYDTSPIVFNGPDRSLCRLQDNGSQPWGRGEWVATAKSPGLRHFHLQRRSYWLAKENSANSIT